MNDYDSDFLAQSLINRGFFPLDDPLNADLVLINTCTVREKPDQKAMSLLGRISAVKKRRSDLIVGIVGCLAQKEGVNLMKRFPFVDLVMGPRELGRIDEFLSRIDGNGEKIVATGLDSTPFRQINCENYFAGRVTGFISIMEGCNNFCSYCIVPFVRGREVSRSPDDIIKEAKGLISQGIKEITLLGQNVNSYHWEEGAWNFVSLIRELSKFDGLWRLRFTTSHPKDLSDELIQCFGEIKNLCRHIHLPFQAGSNSILQKMKRGYTRENYMALVGKLREVSPEIAITSDVMVGFPGETEGDFNMTLDLIKQVQFDNLFSFKYSDREGTLAAKMIGKVEESEKNKRLKTLQDLQKEITLKKNSALKGRQVDVLVEGPSKRGGQLTGRTRTNKIVNFTCDAKLLGSIAKIIVKHASLNSLQGDILVPANKL